MRFDRGALPRAAASLLSTYLAASASAAAAASSRARTAALPPARSQVAQSLPLPDLAQRLAACGAFVGHDSGISHLAAAVGLPGLVLWGDTAEEIWRPPSEEMMVLRHPAGLDRLPAAEVVEQLRRVLVASCGLAPGSGSPA